MNEAARLRWDIEEDILEVANLFNEVDTSDLQGIASRKAWEILDRIKREIDACGITRNQGESLRAVQCLKEKGLV